MAYRGIDFRDLWRRGSGLTLRRLMVLLRALPYDAPLWADLQREQEKALRPTPEQIRARAEHYAQRAKEAG
ncbi:MAG TPA: hypothetical protein VJ782_05130 [Aeromicrobium sp.]|nr:hypothetical protein [Aeromicrobium sp.]